MGSDALCAAVPDFCTNVAGFDLGLRHARGVMWAGRQLVVHISSVDGSDVQLGKRESNPCMQVPMKVLPSTGQGQAVSWPGSASRCH